jgi:protein tyrosine phosphatase (PTP) superfamily phosphohydrolase (DUF442 family)
MDVSQITDYLYLSSRVDPEDVPAVEALDVRLVINMIGHRRSPESLESPARRVLWLRTWDNPLLPISVSKLMDGVELAVQTIEEGHSVLVYCNAGRHRSAAMASCVLIGMGYSADEAMDLVARKREVADPHVWYIQRRIQKFERLWKKRHGGPSPDVVSG